jgi:hypothetical protein
MDKRGVLWVGLLALLGGCAENKQRIYEQDLDRLVTWLPGTYDNTVQARTDAQKGVTPPHDAVELSIVPLGSIPIGRNSFYMQESAADDPRRVLSQRVLMFTVTKKGIVESISTLVDPLRWRDGQRQSDIFMGMTTKDLQTQAGCELTWQRETQPGEDKLDKEAAKKVRAKARFIGVNDSKHCQVTSHAVMGLVQLELRGELSSYELSLGELQYDSDGKLVAGNTAEPFYRFRKVGSR